LKIHLSLLLIGLVLPPTAWAHGEAHGTVKAAAPISAEQHPWGRQGDPNKSTRTVRVTMSDAMRFDPSQLTIKRGETVTFVVHNAGKLMHEFVIGTPAALDAHAQMMKKHPGMEHDEPYLAHVAPGRTQHISWTFNQAGEFLAGCLVAGHWDAGMKATLQVKE
jgi:uncharacterized cupredoxin-like copper-binding protein